MPRVLKAGVNPEVEVARELRIECSPIDFVTEFLSELLIAGWALETLATMLEERTTAFVFDSTASVVGGLLAEVFDERKKEGVDTNALEEKAFDEFKQRLGDKMKSERPITAGETQARSALLGAPPRPAA